jgi:hypothetical protein
MRPDSAACNEPELIMSIRLRDTPANIPLPSLPPQIVPEAGADAKAPSVLAPGAVTPELDGDADWNWIEAQGGNGDVWGKISGYLTASSEIIPRGVDAGVGAIFNLARVVSAKVRPRAR